MYISSYLVHVPVCIQCVEKAEIVDHLSLCVINMMVENEGEYEIIFHNKTKENDIVLMVFARRYPPPLSEEILKMAWKLQLVTSMSNFRFFYPSVNYVSVSYSAEGNRVSSKRELAKPGSVWTTEVSNDGNISLTEEGERLSMRLKLVGG